MRNSTHVAVTFAATFLACGTLIALPDSLTDAHYAARESAAIASTVVTEADTCSETIMAELDVIAEGPSDAERAEYGLIPVPSPHYKDIIATCERLGTDAAYVAIVGPALPACVWEDASASPLPCYWDAATRGNGEGTSYIATVAP